MFERVEMITLDLDDTLWPCFPTIHAAEQALYEWLSARAPALTEDHDVSSLRAHRLAIAERHPEVAHDLTEVRRRSLQVLTREYRLAPEVPDQATEVFRRARNKVHPYAEVVDALKTLRRRYVLAAVTNGNAQVEYTPLADCFDFSFMAEQVGAAKPDPALFNAASQASGVPLRQTLHVGDDPLRDVEAARRAGMKAAWVNREGADWPSGLPAADLVVGDLRQLVVILMGG